MFCEFMDEIRVMDLSMVCRKFTWYSRDGSAFSRLNKYLLSEEWMCTWPNCTKWGLQNGFLDHCVILLRDKEVDWGPKPFKVLNSWKHVEGYKDFVE